jgi:hypothetical protein
MIYKTLTFICFAFSITAVWLIVAENAGFTDQPNKGIASLPDETLGKLARAKIFFGHQSVGSNIMEGVNDLMGQYPSLKLKIEETDTTSAFKGGVFSHGPVGNNEDPASKIDDFAAKVKTGVGGQVDIAFFKFCYIDIMADRNIDEVFSHYQKTMASLKNSYPQTTFVHVTVPLTTVQTGPKAYLKEIIGRAPSGFLENARRNEYNRKLKQTYSGKEPVFDLAQIEATYVDGTRATFEWQGQTYERMIPEYASDGSHLNELGRQRVAEHLIVFFSQIFSDQPNKY